MPSYYSDLGKTAKKLLNDDYVFNSKVKIASKTADGRTYTVTGATDAETTGVDSELTVKQQAGSKLLTTKLQTGGRASTELKLESLGIVGLKATLAGGVGKKAASGKVEFAQGPVALSGVADYYKKALEASATCALTPGKLRGAIVLGAIATYNAETGAAEGVNGAVSYRDGGDSAAEITLHVLERGGKAKLSYSHQIRANLAFASEVTYARADDKVQLTMGAAAKVDAATTLKARLSSNGQCAVTCMQKVAPSTTLTLSTSFDAKTMEAPKCGISIALE